MTIFRRLGLFMCALLFCSCLAAWAFLVGIYGILDTPQPLKTALQSSEIYEEITPNIIEGQAADSELPLKNIGIRTAFEQALPATFYQQSSEQIINGTYNWMHGHTATPEFSIDVTSVKSNLANNVAAHIQQQLDALPPCDDPAAAPPNSAEEALSLTCVPPYTTPAAIANAARQQVQASGLIAEGDTVTPATLQDKQGRSFTEQLAFLPGLYRSYAPALVILPIVIALLALAVVFWSAKRETGLRRVAWMLLSTGLVGVTLAAVGIELLHIGIRLFGLPLAVAFETQDNVLKVIETLAAGARPWWLGVFAGYVVLGIALFIICKVRGPKQTLKFSSKTG